MYELGKVKKRKASLMFSFVFQVNHQGWILFQKQVLSFEVKNDVVFVCLFFVVTFL